MVVIQASFCRGLFGSRLGDIEGWLSSGPLSNAKRNDQKGHFCCPPFFVTPYARTTISLSASARSCRGKMSRTVGRSRRFAAKGAAARSSALNEPLPFSSPSGADG